MIQTFTVPAHIADYCEIIFRKSQLDWRYEVSTLVGEAKLVAEKRYPNLSFIDGLKINDTHSFTLMLLDGVVKFKNQSYKKFKPLHDFVCSQFEINNDDLCRVLMNLQIKSLSPELLINYPHVDSKDTDMYSFLYYINDSDGPTYFFKDNKIIKEVVPRKGTGVFFNSNILHAGAKPRDNNDRIAINYMFKMTQTASQSEKFGQLSSEAHYAGPL